MEDARQADNAIRFSLRSLLAVFACISFIFAVASWTESIVLGINLSLILIAWILWRYAHGHVVGIILVLLGGDVLLSSSVGWVFYGIEDFLGFRVLVNMAASLLVLAGLGVFVWAGSKNQPYAKNQVWIAVSIFCVLTVWWITIPTLGDEVIARRQAADTASNTAAAAKAIALVDDVVKRTGSAPIKEALSELLPEPMPSIRWATSSQQINYQQINSTTYQLWYIDPGMFWGDIITYDSATPQRGWYRVPF